jgi:hypothetical protein
VLLPAGDTDGQRVRTMLEASYDLSTARIDRVDRVAVRAVTPQHPLFPVSRRTAQWSQSVPSYTRADLIQDVPSAADPIWIDLLAEVSATVVTEIDPSGAEAVLSRAFDKFTTLDEFRDRFLFIDLDGFLAKHRISTFEELRDAFDYIVTEVQLRTPPPFDPDDPANTHTLTVRLAVMVVDPFDLAAGLRAARLVRAAAKDLTGAGPTGMPIEPMATYATAVVFAGAGPPQGGPSAAEVAQLYAREGVVSLFLA